MYNPVTSVDILNPAIMQIKSYSELCCFFLYTALYKKETTGSGKTMPI